MALERLADCAVCPRTCGTNRAEGSVGVCKTGRYARVSSAFPHMGEENCLRGWNGSGTIFFEHCNLHCVFCQNYDISHFSASKEMPPHELAQVMLKLQAIGCHNINFVTPQHVVPQMLEALLIAVEGGLHLPLVYNTSAYDAPESLLLLDGVIDIYMPDFKFWDHDLSQRYFKAGDYPDVACANLREMQRQVGTLRCDERGLAKRGILVRHLVMPGCVEESAAIMRFLAEEVSPDTYVNIMPQYRPSGKVDNTHFVEINRRISSSEYREVVQAALAAGLWRLDERW
jgi:putative pyruvate formate lyase activating enzyme